MSKDKKEVTLKVTKKDTILVEFLNKSVHFDKGQKVEVSKRNASALLQLKKVKLVK